MQKKDASVIVLGAGLAGLRAGHLLSKRGVSVTVLEARDRLGGRVYTKQLGENTVELGAEWIGKKDVLMRALCKELSCELIDHTLNFGLLYEGTYASPNTWDMGEGWKKVIETYTRMFPSLTKEQITRLQHVDWWRFLSQQNVSVRDLEIGDLIRSTDFGEDMRFIPAYDVLYDYVVGGEGDNATAFTVQGGNVRLAEALVNEIGSEHVLLNHEVARVIREPQGVTVECSNGMRFSCTQLVVALPLRAVQRIAWEPALDEAYQRACEQVEYSRINKTAFRFSQKFWENDTFALVTDRLPQEIYHATPGQKDGAALLTYTVGDRAFVFSHMSDSEKMGALHDTLSIPFGQEIVPPTELTSYYWGDDPYTGGAYPVFHEDQRTTLQPILRSTQGSIHFAGEHTARRYGFMEGAVESGERVAEEVLKYY